MIRSRAGVQTSVRVHPPTKKLFQIIPTQMMNMEIINLVQEEGSVTIADTLISSVNVVGRAGVS